MISSSIAVVAFLLAPPPSQDLGVPLQAPTAAPACAAQPASPEAQACTPIAPPPVAEPVAPGTAPANPLPDAAGSDDIVVTGRPPSPADPLAKINAKSFEATQAVDKAFIGPVAMAYQHDIPSPVRSGLRNFLRNLHEPVVFLNYLLQLKLGKSAETLGRFAINTTIGGAGLFDIAKRHPFNLPRRPNGFADTLGFYGVKPGPFFFLPLIGPTTLRDLLGNGIDRLSLPLAVGKTFKSPYYNIPANIIRSLDHRAEFDERLTQIRGAGDPYVAARTYYLLQRQAEIDALHHRSGPHATKKMPAVEEYPRPALPAQGGPPSSAGPDPSSVPITGATAVPVGNWGSDIVAASLTVSRTRDDGV